jgi:hypothetical protein
LISLASKLYQTPEDALSRSIDAQGASLLRGACDVVIPPHLGDVNANYRKTEDLRGNVDKRPVVTDCLARGENDTIKEPKVVFVYAQDGTGLFHPMLE